VTADGKRSTVAKLAIARELAGFLWAAVTRQVLRDDEKIAHRLTRHPLLGRDGRRRPRWTNLDRNYATRLATVVRGTHDAALSCGPDPRVAERRVVVASRRGPSPTPTTAASVSARGWDSGAVLHDDVPHARLMRAL
jgi:hypothetical protein